DARGLVVLVRPGGGPAGGGVLYGGGAAAPWRPGQRVGGDAGGGAANRREAARGGPARGRAAHRGKQLLYVPRPGAELGSRRRRRHGVRSARLEWADMGAAIRPGSRGGDRCAAAFRSGAGCGGAKM